MIRPRSRAWNQAWDSSQRVWSGRLWRVNRVGVWGLGMFHYLCVMQLLTAGCRELRNLTQKAGHIPLSGLVLAHSRHNRVFWRRSLTVGSRSRICRVRRVRCVIAFLRRVGRVEGIDSGGNG